MQSSDFVDHYEILEISPNANSGTIERMFRHLARLYHPDNKETGDRARFEEVLEANGILRDPVKRAQYDVQHRAHSEVRWRLESEAAEDGGIDRDVQIQRNLLTILYMRRRQKVSDPGIGEHELERMLGCTPEQLEFQIWYMKQKGWIAKDNGMLAITVEGIDCVALVREKVANKLLTDQTSSLAA